ncbi:DUF6612 family protein [Sporosarcina sp. 179-K 3D1 HS]|uniref:DUF6612 family protein n=1 Tax=Sporosarcina sp. 179-K 3D1 HS TaxID=3232169 RepID=UPI00399FD0AC
MKKNAVILFIFLVVSLLGTSFKVTASERLELFVDDVKIDGHEQPFLKSNGQVWLPVQPVFEAAGFHVTNEKSGHLQVTNSFLTIEFQPRTGVITVNGEAKKTDFPLTLRNAGNYISSDFLSSLEGFKVNIPKDQSAVYVTTNQVQDIAPFLDKVAAKEISGYSSTSKLEHRTIFSYDPEVVKFTIDTDLIVNEVQGALFMKTAMATKLKGRPVKQTSEMFLTKEGILEYKEEIRKWVHLEDEPSAEFMESVLPGPHPIEQLKEIGEDETLQLYDYGDVFVLVQRITDRDNEDDFVSSKTVRYTSTQFDKRTFLPIHALTITDTTIDTDKDSVSIHEQLHRSFIHDDTVKQIRIPEKVLKDAISEKAYWKEIGLFDELDE